MNPLSPPPNPAIAELIDVLGLEETHDLMRVYLREFGGLIRTMASGDREAQHRATHALKSSSRHMGLLPLSRRLEALEARLILPEGKIKSDDLLIISEEFERSTRPLRTYIGEK